MKKFLSLVLITGMFVSFATIQSTAQCKSFTKKKCLPQLDPYVYNGQLNSAVLAQGDVADLNLTFYPDQAYRIFVCSDPILENVHFKLFDKDGTLIYDNESTDYLPFWDFKTDQALELTLRVIVPPKTEDDYTVKEGCVSILIGFKDIDNDKTGEK